MQEKTLPINNGLSKTGIKLAGSLLLSVLLVSVSQAQVVVSEEGFKYDLNGNIEEITTPRGDVLTFEYDKVNRLDKQIFPDGTETEYEYDENGNRSRVTDKNGVSAYIYDPFNRLKTYLFQPNSASGAIRMDYDYDLVGNLIQITYPGGSQINYTYDDNNRLATADFGEGLVVYGYDDVANRLNKITLPNGVVTDYIFNTSRRIDRVVNSKPDGSLLSSYEYDYDANDNRTQIIETTESGSITADYQYDWLDRLTNANYSDGTFEIYVYDSVGNRESKETQDGIITYEYDQDNRLLRAGDVFFVYDKSGNLTKRFGPGKVENYEYDFLNRLVGYEKQVADTPTENALVEYEYDGDGNRISKTTNGVKTYYINNLQGQYSQVMLEATDDFRIKKQYFYGYGRISQSQSGNEDYFIYNYPGRSVVQLVDGNANSKGNYRYDSFGGELVNTGDSTDSFRYVAEHKEIESSMMFLRARYYDPEIGRFIKKDPLGVTGGVNLYLYVNSNPLLGIDPSGLIDVAGLVGNSALAVVSLGGGFISIGLMSNPVSFAGGAALGAASSLGLANSIIGIHDAIHGSSHNSFLQSTGDSLFGPHGKKVGGTIEQTLGYRGGLRSTSSLSSFSDGVDSASMLSEIGGMGSTSLGYRNYSSPGLRIGPTSCY